MWTLQEPTSALTRLKVGEQSSLHSGSPESKEGWEAIQSISRNQSNPAEYNPLGGWTCFGEKFVIDTVRRAALLRSSEIGAYFEAQSSNETNFLVENCGESTAGVQLLEKSKTRGQCKLSRSYQKLTLRLKMRTYSNFCHWNCSNVWQFASWAHSGAKVDTAEVGWNRTDRVAMIKNKFPVLSSPGLWRSQRNDCTPFATFCCLRLSLFFFLSMGNAIQRIVTLNPPIW